MGAGYHGGFGGTQGARNAESKSQLIAELRSSGTKFSLEDMIFITRDQTGQIIWLEQGSPSAGLEHILNGNGRTPGHADDFARAFGISRDRIPQYLKEVITHGKVVSNEIRTISGRQGYTRTYFYNGNYQIVTGIGTNGFIVSAYPKSI